MFTSGNTLGMRKHRQACKTSGTLKSPKLRHAMARDAAKNDVKPRRMTCYFNTVAEAMACSRYF